MRNSSSWWIIIIVMLVIDIYFFMAVRTVSQNSSEKMKWTVNIIYWLISALGIITIIMFPFVEFFQTNVVFRNYVFAI